MPQYTSHMSLVVVSELGGRQVSRSDVMVKVPQVAGKLCELMNKLNDGFGNVDDGVMGNDKFCNIQYLSVCPGLGMIDIGEDWNRPIRVSIVTFEVGLMYLLI